MNVRFHAEAKKEYREAIQFYRSIDKQLAEHFVRQIDRALQQLSLRPRTFPILAGPFRRFLLKHFPFGVHYTLETEEQVVIWAIAHFSRKPGYWRARRL